MTTTSVSSISTNYSSELTNASATYPRMGSTGYFYYEAIEVTPSLTGSHTFLSSSRMDTYGFLYLTSVNGSNLSENLLTLNDDDGGNFQFLFAYTLQAGSTYIVIFTTFSGMVTGQFSLGVYGPSRVSLRRIDLILITITTSTNSSTFPPSPLTTVGPSCVQANTRPLCPGNDDIQFPLIFSTRRYPFLLVQAVTHGRGKISFLFNELLI